MKEAAAVLVVVVVLAVMSVVFLAEGEQREGMVVVVEVSGICSKSVQLCSKDATGKL